MELFFKNILSNIGITDVLDIAIVTFLIYWVLRLMRETRAEQLLKGIVIFLAALLISDVAHLYTLHWILSALGSVGLVAIVVIFQPELRRALEQLGRTKLTSVWTEVDKEEAKRLVGELTEAISYMSKTKTGALMVFEQEITLNDIVETGTVIDARVTEQMVRNVFYEGAPLHDGAMIIRGDRIHAAGCVLPLTQNKKVSKDLGTRHRASLGISENSDAFVIVVSEETGVISMVQDGEMTRFLDPKTVEKKLYSLYIDEGNESISEKLVDFVKGTVKHGKRGDK